MQKVVASHGCEVVYAPLEIPSGIGKVERPQGVMKAMLRKVVADTESSWPEQFWNMLVWDPHHKELNDAPEWTQSGAMGVIGRRHLAVTDLDESGNLGVLEAKFNSSAQFFLQQAAQRAFVRLDTSSQVARALTRNVAVQSQVYSVGDLVCYRRDTQAGGTQWLTACRIIGHDPHQGVWLLHEGVPVLCSAAKLRSANEAESLAYSLMNSIPVLPEVIVSGPQQQKCIKVVEEKEPSSSSTRGQKRDPEMVESRDKTGKAARQAPKTPGALEDDVMMAELETKDHWRVSGRCAIRMHVEPRFHDFSPLREGGMPEGFVASNACKVRKGFQDGSQKDCEVILGLGNRREVESQASTGFTIFRRAQDPNPYRAMADLEAAISVDKSYEAFVAQRINFLRIKRERLPRLWRIMRLGQKCKNEWMKQGQRNGRNSRLSMQWLSCTVKRNRRLDEGHEVVPSKSVETIKNIHQEQPGYVPVHKARLVSCGNFERVEKGELRCDSPTSDPECHLLLASFAVTMKWTLCTADIANAYFQSAPMTRLSVMVAIRTRGFLACFVWSKAHWPRRDQQTSGGLWAGTTCCWEIIYQIFRDYQLSCWFETFAETTNDECLGSGFYLVDRRTASTSSGDANVGDVISGLRGSSLGLASWRGSDSSDVVRCFEDWRGLGSLQARSFLTFRTGAGMWFHVAAVFLRYGSDQKLWPYSAATLRQKFSQLLAAVGLQTKVVGGVRPFDLGSWATWLLNQTEDSNLVQRRGSWMSYRVMTIYLQ